MILIISSLNDGHAVEVSNRLGNLGAEHRLLDLSRFPQKADLGIEFGAGGKFLEIVDGGDTIDLSRCGVVWWRRPQPFALHDEITATLDRNFAYTEWQAALSGLWLSLDAFWMNHPTREDEASRKVHQLHLAREIGLRIPDTCVTSSPSRAAHFIEKFGGGNVIYKAFSGTEEEWRETRRLKDSEVALIDSVRFAPVIFQEYIPGGVDLRITVIGDQFFTGAIYSEDTSYNVDFRMVMDEVRMESFDLPGEIKFRLLELMGRLGLCYGAIDMRLDPEGEFVFLEINPSGQWLFVEYGTGLPISDALARFLIQNDRDASLPG
ncbi:MAG: alpha-L-glutamate ligase [Gemmatimonadaceae bacterium]|nr:alpha-L-glutamate ligase [Gemmatimonadaceae bacterium]